MTETVQEENVSAKLQKIANHLVFLEKKIDMLIEKSSQSVASRHTAGQSPYRGTGFRPREGQSASYGAPRREGGFRPPQRSYSGPTGAHGTRTARYEGSAGGNSAHRPSSRPPNRHRPHRSNHA